MAMTMAAGRGASSPGSAAAAAGASWDGGTDPVGNRGALPQPASVPTMASATDFTTCFMLLILLEALLALALLVLIVWWTMFSGRPGGEPPAQEEARKPGADDSDTAGKP